MAEQLNWTELKKMKIIPTNFSGHSDMKQKENDKIYKYVNTEKTHLRTTNGSKNKEQNKKLFWNKMEIKHIRFYGMQKNSLGGECIEKNAYNTAYERHLAT